MNYPPVLIFTVGVNINHSNNQLISERVPLRHPELSGIIEMDPMSMDQGAAVQPFDKKLFKAAARTLITWMFALLLINK